MPVYCFVKLELRLTLVPKHDHSDSFSVSCKHVFFYERTTGLFPCSIRASFFHDAVFYFCLWKASFPSVTGQVTLYSPFRISDTIFFAVFCRFLLLDRIADVSSTKQKKVASPFPKFRVSYLYVDDTRLRNALQYIKQRVYERCSTTCTRTKRSVTSDRGRDHTARNFALLKHIFLRISKLLILFHQCCWTSRDAELISSSSIIFYWQWRKTPLLCIRCIFSHCKQSMTYWQPTEH